MNEKNYYNSENFENSRDAYYLNAAKDSEGDLDDFIFADEDVRLCSER